MRGKYVLLVPSTISTDGVNKLARELELHGVTVVGKDSNLILAKLDENSRLAIAKGLSIQAYYVDEISPRAIQKLPKPVARVAELWNWSISKHGRRVTGGEVDRLMKKLQLKVRDGQVYDNLAKKNIGKVESGETEEKKGNWTLSQSRGWSIIPGFFGWWEKLWCKTRTYSSESSRLVVDYIVAEVDGPQHYAAQYKYNASIAYAEAWAYIWVGQSHCGTAFSYARNGDSTLSITGTIC